ncbi:23450_t:CDS:2 [Gigaspora margarita]|uniref:23450_t:CDS:1 n=1 Tax=Gigaspora margarita TaxID=4874 RepID=A0ABN7VQ04_GIGMA|nr:23450_t:CDS:2 [Gigaspora margarita]
MPYVTFLNQSGIMSSVKISKFRKISHLQLAINLNFSYTLVDIAGINESRALFFNNEEDIDCYPTLAVASTYKNSNQQTGITSLGIRSIIPKYDTSGLITTAIVGIPKPDHPEDIVLGLEKTSNNTGKGAFDDITFIVRPLTRGGHPPPGVQCGTEEYPVGFIYSSPFIVINMFYHPEK